MRGSCNNFPQSADKCLVVATSSSDKFFEIRSSFGQLGIRIQLLSLRDFDSVPQAPETGNTFAENALQKARFYYSHLRQSVLAEDSGLVVPALHGFPGIHSARIAPDDASRMRVVLERLTPGTDRSAYYVCSMVLLHRDKIFPAEATCAGTIVDAPDGDQGFGYDPIFRPKGAPRTFGRMTVKEKSQYSHRARALQLMIPHILTELG